MAGYNSGHSLSHAGPTPPCQGSSENEDISHRSCEHADSHPHTHTHMHARTQNTSYIYNTTCLSYFYLHCHGQGVR